MSQETKATKFLTRYPFCVALYCVEIVVQCTILCIFILFILLVIIFVFIVIFYGNPLPLPLTPEHKFYFTPVL